MLQRKANINTGLGGFSPKGSYPVPNGKIKVQYAVICQGRFTYTDSCSLLICIIQKPALSKYFH